MNINYSSNKINYLILRCTLEKKKGKWNEDVFKIVLFRLGELFLEHNFLKCNESYN